MEKPSLGLKTNLKLSQKELLRHELAEKVDVAVERHWDEKITDGIIPTDIKLKGPVDRILHKIISLQLAEFEAEELEGLLSSLWKVKQGELTPELHYFGIGTGWAFKKVVPLANSAGYNVVGYDTSSVGWQNGEAVLLKQETERENCVYLADIHHVCQKKYIRPERARLLVASRVLDVLTKQELGWEKKAPEDRKTARTARRIGKLLSYVDVFLIHPCANDNPNAIWGDTTPYTLQEVRGYMEQGLGAEVDCIPRKKFDFHGNIYTSVVFRRKK